MKWFVTLLYVVSVIGMLAATLAAGPVFALLVLGPLLWLMFRKL